MVNKHVYAQTRDHLAPGSDGFLVAHAAFRAIERWGGYAWDAIVQKARLRRGITVSEVLAEIARKFVHCNLPAHEFSGEFIQRWKHERDSGQLLQDSPFDSEIFSSIFCMADLYNPQPDREDYELDEERLRMEVERLINQNLKHDA